MARPAIPRSEAGALEVRSPAPNSAPRLPRAARVLAPALRRTVWGTPATSVPRGRRTSSPDAAMAAAPTRAHRSRAVRAAQGPLLEGTGEPGPSASRCPRAERPGFPAQGCSVGVPTQLGRGTTPSDNPTRGFYGQPDAGFRLSTGSTRASPGDRSSGGATDAASTGAQSARSAPVPSSVTTWAAEAEAAPTEKATDVSVRA